MISTWWYGRAEDRGLQAHQAGMTLPARQDESALALLRCATSVQNVDCTSNTTLGDVWNAGISRDLR